MSEKSTYTYAVTKGNYPNAVNEAMKARGNWKQLNEEVGLEQADFFWRCNNLGIVGYDSIDNRMSLSSKPFVFNHFEVIKGICQKTGLIRSLETYYEQHPLAKKAGYTVFDTTPTTFVIARNIDDNAINMFMQRFRELTRGFSQKERVPIKHCAENMWLVKPAAMNQGRGIEMFKNMREIHEFIYQRNH
jgi:hypothetical protein